MFVPFVCPSIFTTFETQVQKVAFVDAIPEGTSFTSPDIIPSKFFRSCEHFIEIPPNEPRGWMGGLDRVSKFYQVVPKNLSSSIVITSIDGIKNPMREM